MIEGTTVRSTDDNYIRRNTGEAIAFSGYFVDELSWREQLIVSPGLRIERYEMALTDRLAQINDRRMTATEVLARSSEIVRLLGATYGRLQSELLTPLMMQGYTILRQRGQIPDLSLDGRFVALDYRSPLARAQAQNNVQNILSWVNASTALGAAATEAVDLPATIRFLGEALGVPGHLIIRELPPIPTENTL